MPYVYQKRVRYSHTHISKQMTPHSFSIEISHMYDKCMTKQNENRVVDAYNAVSARSEADSNRCTRFCRPLPSHSAIRPFLPEYPVF